MRRKTSIDEVSNLEQRRTLMMFPSLEHPPRCVICHDALERDREVRARLERHDIQCMDEVSPGFEALRGGLGLVFVCLGRDVPGPGVGVDNARRGGADTVCDVVAALKVGSDKKWNYELAVGEDVAGDGVEAVCNVHLGDDVDELLFAIWGENEGLCIDLYGGTLISKAYIEIYKREDVRSVKPFQFPSSFFFQI